jgi:hypothetical protein
VPRPRRRGILNLVRMICSQTNHPGRCLSAVCVKTPPARNRKSVHATISTRPKRFQTGALSNSGLFFEEED